MAFSGLPSKSCANCRQRRIKCNLGEPECAQCRRAGKECPGYRDQLALLFRDENEKVIRKARGRPPLMESQKSKSVKKQLQDIETHGFKINSSRTTISDSNPTPSELQLWSRASSPSISASPSVSPCMEDPGVIFFFHHYMTATSPASSGQPDIFSSHIWRGVSQKKHFIDAISCVGLAGLSNVNNDPQMMTIARQKYGITLQRVVAALQAHRRADIGYILKAVMMLTLFEMINCDTPTADLCWVHMDGIAALLNSEEFRQFHFKLGTHIKHQFFFAMFIKYIQSGQKCPTSVAKWARSWGQNLRDVDSPVASLAQIIMQFLDLNADVREGIAIDANRVLRDALNLDDALEEWKVALPPAWNYKVVTCSRTLGTYNGQYHIYSNHWLARMWDHYRWIRILVHELILTQLSSLPFVLLKICGQKSKSLRMVSHVASQICVGISSQLYLPNDGILGTPSQSQMNSVFMLLWPLKVAGSAIGVSETLHEWVLDTLERIEQTMGIRRTKMVICQTVAQREYWKSTGAYGSGK